MKKNLLSSAPTPIRLHIPDFRRVAVTLVGCGGTGSHIASGLVALQAALDERDIILDAVLMDPDIVEQKNVGRQLFAFADIGKPKRHQGGATTWLQVET
jgi:molybdopterin/thiamine biosynthesis adenylyltransferase